MSTSQGFDFWQSTERLHCTGATLVLVLLATCCFNEVEAASLSKQTLFSCLWGIIKSQNGPIMWLLGLFNSFSFKSSIFSLFMRSLSDCRQHESEIVSSGASGYITYASSSVIASSFCIVHHKHFSVPLRF